MAPDPVDPAAAALSRVKAAGGRTSRRRTRRAPVQFSGSGPDSRDPGLLGGLMDEWVRRNGYTDQLAVSGLAERWTHIVGEQIAAHVQVAGYRPGAEGGTLMLRAESPAWALQTRYMVGDILQRISAEIGPALVTALEVRGPGPERAAGRLRVRHGRRSPRV